MNPNARLTRLEAQRKTAQPDLVAVVNVLDMTPAEAEKAIAERRQALQQAGFSGRLVIVDA